MTHTVLLVEEDVEFLRSMARMLASEPYRVYTVRSAAEAVGLMKSRAVDAIVAGDGLNVMSAVDLFAWVVGKYPVAVCVLLAGEGSMESVIRAVNEGGAFQVVARPCDAVQLAAAVRKALAHSDCLKAQSRLGATAGDLEADRRRFAEELETLRRQIGRDVEKPLTSIAESCQALLEKHPDLFDSRAKALIQEAREAAADMQCLIEDLAGRIRGRQSANLAVETLSGPVAQPDACAES